MKVEKKSFVPKRRCYSVGNLLRKRFNSIAQERPSELLKIKGITELTESPNDKYRRYVVEVLDKLTPQTYEICLSQLDALEFNSIERLEIMISMILTKAIETDESCSLYATLCKHFQDKQLTVRNKNGQLVTYFFTETLLTRCQKEFEVDYRQEMEYKKQKTVVETSTNDGIPQKTPEKLKRDLDKAKRKKLRYIMYVTKKHIIK